MALETPIAAADMIKFAANLAERFEKRANGGKEPLSQEDYAELAVVLRWLSQEGASI
jgi:hypothetical protein